MKKKVLVGFLLACAVVLLGAVTVNGVKLFDSYVDFKLITAPSNPSVGFLRLFGNTGTTKIACLDSTGANCIPSSGGSGVTHAHILQSVAVLTSLTLAFPFNVTSGNPLLIALGWQGGAATNPSCTDTVGTTFTPQVVISGNSFADGAILTGPANASGADTVVCILPVGGNTEALFINEVSAASLTLTPDGTASVSDSSALQLTTTRNGDTLFVLCFGFDNAAHFENFGFEQPLTLSGNDSAQWAISRLGAEVAGLVDVSVINSETHSATVALALEGP